MGSVLLKVYPRSSLPPSCLQRLRLPQAQPTPLGAWQQFLLLLLNLWTSYQMGTEPGNDGALANDAVRHLLPFEQTQNCHLLDLGCLCV